MAGNDDDGTLPDSITLHSSPLACGSQSPLQLRSFKNTNYQRTPDANVGQGRHVKLAMPVQVRRTDGHMNRTQAFFRLLAPGNFLFYYSCCCGLSCLKALRKPDCVRWQAGSRYALALAHRLHACMRV